MTIWEWKMFVASKPAEIICQGRKLQREKISLACMVK